MDTLWRVIAWASIGLVALSAFSMVRSLGQDRPLRGRSLVLTAAVSLVAAGVYVVLLPAGPGAWAWVLGAVGLAGGALVSRSTRLSRVGAQVLGRPSPLLALQWAVLFGVAQAAALAQSVDVAMGALFLATGVSVGGALVLLRRRAALATADISSCPHCHAALAPGADRCGQCSWRVRTRLSRTAWPPPLQG